MIDIRNSIRALVKIQTPSFIDAETGEKIEENSWNFDSSQGDIGADILSLSVNKTINSPFGRFSLNLSPRIIARNKSWADLIPPYSLVEIRLQSYPRDKQPVLVMVGLVDDVTVSESYQSAQQDRSIQVTGKESTCLFVDQKTYTVPIQLDRIDQANDLNLPELYSQRTMLLGTYNIAPDLITRGDTPYDAFEKFFKVLITGGAKTETSAEGIPLVNLDLPFNPSTRDKLAISDIITYDPEKTKNNMPDPRMTYFTDSNTIQNGIPIWSLMSGVISPHFFELFTISKEVDNRGVNEVILRKPPFAGRISASGEIIENADFEQSQLDPDILTTELGDVDVISRSLQRSADKVKNFIRVNPVFLDQNADSDPWLLQSPLIDNADDSPSSVRRFGLRLYNVDDYYLAQGAPAIEVSKQRQRMFWYWYRFEPLFKFGDYTVRGNPSIDIGTRMTHDNYEYYVTSVSHNFMATSLRPSFLTKLTVERGWPIK